MKVRAATTEALVARTASAILLQPARRQRASIPFRSAASTWCSYPRRRIRAPLPYREQHCRMHRSSHKVDPMSSTIFEPVFSAGASCHPVETLDTWAEGAGEAQRRRPAALRLACAKIPLVPPARSIHDRARQDGGSRAPDAVARCCRTGNTTQSPVGLGAGCRSRLDTPPRI
jgi:hypothetical protein